MARLGVCPGQALFLDDDEACVDGARAIGMRAVRFLDNEQAISRLDEHLGRSSGQHPVHN